MLVIVTLTASRIFHLTDQSITSDEGTIQEFIESTLDDPFMFLDDPNTCVDVSAYVRHRDGTTTLPIKPT